LQVFSPIAHIGIEGDTQTDVVIAADKCLTLVAGDAGGAEVILPGHGVDFFDDGAILRVVRRDCALVAEGEGVFIGQDDAPFLDNFVEPLLDLYKDF